MIDQTTIQQIKQTLVKSNYLSNRDVFIEDHKVLFQNTENKLSAYCGKTGKALYSRKYDYGPYESDMDWDVQTQTIDNAVKAVNKKLAVA